MTRVRPKSNIAPIFVSRLFAWGVTSLAVAFLFDFWFAAIWGTSLIELIFLAILLFIFALGVSCPFIALRAMPAALLVRRISSRWLSENVAGSACLAGLIGWLLMQLGWLHTLRGPVFAAVVGDFDAATTGYFVTRMVHA